MNITEIVAKRLKLFSKRRVVNLLDGNYDSVFKGRGVEFEGLRDYVAGDDVRTIDWRATARTRRTQTRTYAPLRDQRIVVVADISPSFNIPGYTGVSKKDALYGLAVILGMFVRKNRDLMAVCYSKPNGRISLTRFGNTNNHIERGLRTLDESIRKTSPKAARPLSEYLQHLVSSLRRRSAIFVVTDTFQETDQLKQLLNKLQARHQVFFTQIAPSWPFSDELHEDADLIDVETGVRFSAELAINTDLQDEWKAMLGEYQKNLRLVCKSSGVPYGFVDDIDTLPEELRKLFMQSRQYAGRR